jgi:transposase
MAKPLLSDPLWKRIEPLLPPPKPRRARSPGRKPLDARKVLTGILFVLKWGIPWEDLPKEMNCGCGMTCLNYLKSWQQAGVWDRVEQVLRGELAEAERIDWTRARLDTARSQAPEGKTETGVASEEREKSGIGRHECSDAEHISPVESSTDTRLPEEM